MRPSSSLRSRSHVAPLSFGGKEKTQSVLIKQSILIESIIEEFDKRTQKRIYRRFCKKIKKINEEDESLSSF